MWVLKPDSQLPKKILLFTFMESPLKLVPAIFYQIFISHQMIAPQKIWKMFFISSKKLFPFSRYSGFCIFIFSSFSPANHCFKGWSKKNLKVYDAIICLSKNLKTHFAWYLEKEIRCDIDTVSIIRVSKNRAEKNHAENVYQQLVLDPFLILQYKLKQLLHAINSFKNKIFWKKIIKKP